MGQLLEGSNTLEPSKLVSLGSSAKCTVRKQTQESSESSSSDCDDDLEKISNRKKFAHGKIIKRRPKKSNLSSFREDKMRESKMMRKTLASLVEAIIKPKDGK